MKKPNEVSRLGRGMAGTLPVPGKRSMMSGVHELCRALEIVPRHQTLEAFHQDQETKPRVLALIRDQYRLLPDGSLRVKKEKDSGPLRSLYSEPKGKSNKRGLRSEIAIKTVRRLLGFVLYEENRWTLPPSRSRGHGVNQGEKSAFESHKDAYAVVPARVRKRIRELWESAPNDLNEYAESAASFLQNTQANPLPETPPWNFPSKFQNGHEFIFEFLEGVKESTARTTITVASINSYITASIGRQLLLKALQRGARVRFLIFDFIHGDVKRVARLIRRSEEAFYVFANDTVEALLQLHDNARRAGVSKNLEIRLLKEDPVGRWYVLDEPSNTRAFFALRQPDTISKAADAEGGRVLGKGAVEQEQTVSQLWNKARGNDISSWRPHYEAWRAKPETRRILGQVEGWSGT